MIILVGNDGKKCVDDNNEQNKTNGNAHWENKIDDLQQQQQKKNGRKSHENPFHLQHIHTECDAVSIPLCNNRRFS